MSQLFTWHERFFEGQYGKVLAAMGEGDQSERDAALVKKLLRVRKQQCVLDVPCGYGRLTIPLARMGLRMTGVDRTNSYLRRARRLAKETQVDIDFQGGDMRKLEFDGEFHGVFNWFGSFGYFGDEENLCVAKSVLSALRPGGRFLVEGMNKSWLLENFKAKREQRSGGVVTQNQGRWHRETQRLVDTWTLSSGGRTERHTISMRIYNGTEIRSLLRAAGFDEIQLYGDRPPGRFTRHSRRWIAVARRA